MTLSKRQRERRGELMASGRKVPMVCYRPSETTKQTVTNVVYSGYERTIRSDTLLPLEVWNGASLPCGWKIAENLLPRSELTKLIRQNLRNTARRDRREDMIAE